MLCSVTELVEVTVKKKFGLGIRYDSALIIRKVATANLGHPRP